MQKDVLSEILFFEGKICSCIAFESSDFHKLGFEEVAHFGLFVINLFAF